MPTVRAVHTVHFRDITFCCGQPSCCCTCTDEERNKKMVDVHPSWQPTLEQALRERDVALVKVEEAADSDWLSFARKAVEALAAETWPDGVAMHFTTDDVWFMLDEMQVSPPREPRAMGPVMQKALRDKVVHRTGNYAQSVRRHGSPIPVYQGVQTLKG